MDLFYDYNFHLGKLSFDRNNLKEKMIFNILRFLADNFNFYFF